MALELDYMEYANDGLAQAAYPSSDVIDNDIKLLLHLDGADGAQATSDSSPSNHTINFNGTAELDDAQKKWGATSLLVDGNSDWLDIDDHADWNIGTNFTIDSWVRHTDYSGSEYYVAHWEDTGNNWRFGHIGGAGLIWNYEQAGGNDCRIQEDGVISDSNWHHTALIKVGNLWGIYLDGIQVAYLSNAFSDTYVGSLYIGARGTEGSYFDGHLDEIRVTHENHFGAVPNVGKTDTITAPTSEHNTIALQCYSEAGIKQQGSYSLKGFAGIFGSLNDTLTRTIGSPIDLSGIDTIKFDIYSSRTGANIKIGIHDSGGTTSEKTHTQAGTGAWETVTWDISGVSNANKDAIDSIIITVVNADAGNTFYIDNMYAEDVILSNALFFGANF